MSGRGALRVRRRPNEPYAAAPALEGDDLHHARLRIDRNRDTVGLGGFEGPADRVSWRQGVEEVLVQRADLDAVGLPRLQDHIRDVEHLEAGNGELQALCRHEAAVGHAVAQDKLRLPDRVVIDQDLAVFERLDGNQLENGDDAAPRPVAIGTQAYDGGILDLLTGNRRGDCVCFRQQKVGSRRSTFEQTTIGNSEGLLAHLSRQAQVVHDDGAGRCCYEKGDTRRRYTLEIGDHLDIDHLPDLHAHAVAVRSRLAQTERLRLHLRGEQTCRQDGENQSQDGMIGTSCHQFARFRDPRGRSRVKTDCGTQSSEHPDAKRVPEAAMGSSGLG